MNLPNILARQGHRLLQIGVALFLFTSFEGFAIPYFASPIVGRSVHTLSALFGLMPGRPVAPRSAQRDRPEKTANNIGMRRNHRRFRRSDRKRRIDAKLDPRSVVEPRDLDNAVMAGF